MKYDRILKLMSVRYDELLEIKNRIEDSSTKPVINKMDSLISKYADTMSLLQKTNR